MISYKPAFISKSWDYMVGGAALGLMAIATLSCLPFEPPDYVMEYYSCGKVRHLAEEVRVYHFTANFRLSRENFDMISNIAQKHGLVALPGRKNNLSFFNLPGEDGLVRSTIIPTGAVDSALEEICNAIDKAA